MNNYQPGKTFTKAAPPFVVIILVAAAQAALKAANITIDDQTLYTAALAGLGAFTAFVNWLKHRKDKAA